MPPARRRRSRALAAALATGAAALLALDWMLVATPVENAALSPGKGSGAPAAAEEGPAKPPPALEPLEAFAEIGERDLFSSTRRRIVAAAAETTAAEAQAGDAIRLGGILLQEGRSSALLRPEEGAATWVAEGASFAEWSVSEIGAGGVVLRAGERELRLELYPDRAGSRNVDP